MHEPNSDLDSAVEFIIGRIDEAASRSGEPFTEHEKHFLHHLPKRPTNPTVNLSRGFYSRVALPTPTLRDFSFERLCALAKDAHRQDLEMHPSAATEWRFAGAVLGFNNHPMAWLLHWAGIRTLPRWDGCLLVFTAILVVVLGSLVVFATLMLKRGEGGLPISLVEIV
jgi:hypothetical protein